MDRRRFLPTYHYEDNTDGVLPESVGKPLRDYKIYGNSIQDGVPSPEEPVEIQSVGDMTVNLFDKDAEFDVTRGLYIPTINIEGETVICSHDGRFGVLYIGAWAIPTKGNTEFTISAKNISFPSNGGYFYIREADEIPTTIDTSNMFGTQITIIQRDVNNYRYTFTTDKKYLFILCAPSVGGVVSFKELQLQTGTTATAYEPYGYKVPVKVTGKNLFDISRIENISLSNGGKITNNQDGSLTIEGIYAVPCQKTLSQLVPELKVGDTVVLNAESNAYREGSGKLNIVYLNDGTTVYFGEPITITQSNLDAKVLFYSRMMSSDTTDIEPSYYKNIQLEYGTEATAYEPYVETQTHNIYLDEPLRKVDEYADYIDFKNGCVVRNIIDVSLQNQEFHVVPNYPNVWAFDTGVTLISYNNVLCTHFPSRNNLFSNCYVCNVNNPGTRISIRNVESELGITIDEFNEWLTQNDMHYFAILQDTVNEPITLPPIPTIKGTVNVTVDTDVEPSSAVWQYYRR